MAAKVNQPIQSADREWPHISEHAADRWHARADQPWPPVGPRVAWRHGQLLDQPHGVDADEVRYYPPAHAVLVMKEDSAVVGNAVETQATIVTVINPTEPDTKPTLREAIVRSSRGEIR